MSDKTRVVIGLPSAGLTQVEALNCLWLQAYHLGAYQKDHPEFEFLFCPRGRMFTPMNREVIITFAVNAKADYLFMVDDDMLFKPDLFEQLYRHHVDIVAPLAFTRNPPHLAVLYQAEKGWDPIEKKEYFNFEWIKNYPRNKLVECDAVGFGAVLINLKIIPRMQRPFFMCSSGTGEDIYFCLKAKEAGAKVFMDTSVILGHLGAPLVIDQETSEKFNEPEFLAKVHGPYRRYEVFDICHQEAVKDADKQEVVLAR